MTVWRLIRRRVHLNRLFGGVVEVGSGLMARLGIGEPNRRLAKAKAETPGGWKCPGNDRQTTDTHSKEDTERRGQVLTLQSPRFTHAANAPKLVAIMGFRDFRPRTGP